LSIYVMKGHGAIAISRTGAAAQQTRHRLSELLTIEVCAALSGADGFEDIASGRAPAVPAPAKTGPSGVSCGYRAAGWLNAASIGLPAFAVWPLSA
jgi:hypothetical protein